MHDSTTALVADLPQKNNSSSVSRTPQVNRLTPAELNRNKIIEEYLPCVGSVLAKVQRGLPAHVNADDLYSAGVSGLIAAAERYDATQTETFRGYVCLRIRGAMLDELRRSDSCSRRGRAWQRKIQVAIQESEQALGRAPTDRELSERLDISVSDLVRHRDMAKPVQIISLDAERDSGTATTTPLHEMVADQNHEDVRETMEKDELKELLMERLMELPDLQRKILALYYFEGLRFSEIGEVFDLTEGRICQIHRQAVAALRAFIRPTALGQPRVADFLGGDASRGQKSRAKATKMKLDVPGVRVAGQTRSASK